MKQYDLAEGMRMYIARLREQGRYSSAKSYQDALNSFLRFCGQEVIPYTRIDREMLLRYQDYLRDRECSWNTVSTYMRRIRRVYGLAMENGEAPFSVSKDLIHWDHLNPAIARDTLGSSSIRFSLRSPPFVDDRSVG